MNENPAALLPEIALAAAAVGGLLTGSWLPRRRQGIVVVLAAAACVAALVATAIGLHDDGTTVFGHSFAVDPVTGSVRIVVLAATLVVLCLSAEHSAGHRRQTEFVVLILLSSLGTLMLAGASDLLTLFAGFLLTSVPGYALAGFAKDAAGTEAAMKYYLLGAFAGVIMLTGIALLYGAGHSTGYAALHQALPAGPHTAAAVGTLAILTGLLFKAGAVPAHFWIPDVIDGTPPTVAAFLSTVPKIGALAGIYRLLDVAIPTSAVNWRLLIAVVAAASMTLGNLAAFAQTSVQRLLGYSTISQVGYLLLAVVAAGRSDAAQKGLLYYLGAYAVTNLAAFAVVAELPRARTLADYRGLAGRRPALAAVLTVALLGLVGTPPTSVFVGKLEVFRAAIDSGYSWLAVLAAINTVASLFYYLRWLAPVFARPPAPLVPAAVDVLAPAGRWYAIAAYTTGAASLALGPLAGLALPLATGTLLR